VPSQEWLEAHPKSLFENDLAGELLWATQPWMSLNALLVAAVGYTLLRRRRYFGLVTGTILVQYSISRAFIESYRGDDARGVWFGGALSTSQIIAVFSVLAGLGIILTARRRPLPGRLAPADAWWAWPR
jgi:prolipoprotein diacylglyceryltransferase